MPKSRIEQKANTRKQILRTAKRLFLENGYTQTTLRDIAREAGVAIGTTFTHFPGKAALLAATLVEDVDNVLKQAFETMAEGSVVETLTHPSKALYAHYAQIPDLARTWVRETLFMEGPWGERVFDQIEEGQKGMTQYLESLKAEGRLRPESDCTLLGTAIMSHYHSMLVMGLKLGLPLQQQIDLFVKLVASQLHGYLIEENRRKQ